MTPCSPATTRGQQPQKRLVKPSTEQRPTSWTPPDTAASSCSPRLDRPKAAPPDRSFGAPPVPPEKPQKTSHETTPVNIAGSSKPPEPPVKPSVYPTKPESTTTKLYQALPVVEVSEARVSSAVKMQGSEGSTGGTGMGASRPPRPQLPPQLRPSTVKSVDEDDAKKVADSKENKGLSTSGTLAR